MNEEIERIIATGDRVDLKKWLLLEQNYILIGLGCVAVKYKILKNLQ